MNTKILLIVIAILLLFLFSYESKAVISGEHARTVSLDKGYYYIDKYIDSESNNTCYILYGTQFGGAIGAFGSISCVKNEVININITGGK